MPATPPFLPQMPKVPNVLRLSGTEVMGGLWPKVPSWQLCWRQAMPARNTTLADWCVGWDRGWKDKCVVRNERLRILAPTLQLSCTAAYPLCLRFRG